MVLGSEQPYRLLHTTFWPNLNNMYLVLAQLETLLLVGGTYDEPIHNINFRRFSYMHTTWSKP